MASGSLRVNVNVVSWLQHHGKVFSGDLGCVDRCPSGTRTLSKCGKVILLRHFSPKNELPLTRRWVFTPGVTSTAD